MLSQLENWIFINFRIFRTDRQCPSKLSNLTPSQLRHMTDVTSVFSTLLLSSSVNDEIPGFGKIYLIYWKSVGIIRSVAQFTRWDLNLVDIIIVDGFIIIQSQNLVDNGYHYKISRNCSYNMKIDFIYQNHSLIHKNSIRKCSRHGDSLIS